MALDDQDMYAIYTAGIAKAFAQPPNVPNLILAGNVTPANLAYTSVGLPAPPTQQEAMCQIYTLGNNELAAQGFYTPTGNQFFSQYATFIDNLVPSGSQKSPTPTQAAQIKMIKNSLAAATAQYATDQGLAYAAWKLINTMMPGQYSDFASYLRQTAWGSTVNTDANLMNGLNSQLAMMYSTVYGQDYVPINLAKTTVDNVRTAMLGSAANGPTVMLISTDDSPSVPLVVPSYISDSLAQFSSWVDQTISQHENTGEQPITIGFLVVGHVRLLEVGLLQPDQLGFRFLVLVARRLVDLVKRASQYQFVRFQFQHAHGV